MQSGEPCCCTDKKKWQNAEARKKSVQVPKAFLDGYAGTTGFAWSWLSCEARTTEFHIVDARVYYIHARITRRAPQQHFPP